MDNITPTPNQPMPQDQEQSIPTSPNPQYVYIPAQQSDGSIKYIPVLPDQIQKPSQFSTTHISTFSNQSHTMENQRSYSSCFQNTIEKVCSLASQLCAQVQPLQFLRILILSQILLNLIGYLTRYSTSQYHSTQAISIAAQTFIFGMITHAAALIGTYNQKKDLFLHYCGVLKYLGIIQLYTVTYFIHYSAFGRKTITLVIMLLCGISCLISYPHFTKNQKRYFEVQNENQVPLTSGEGE